MLRYVVNADESAQRAFLGLQGASVPERVQ